MSQENVWRTGKISIKVIAHWAGIFACVFPFSKCMLQMQKGRKSNLIPIFLAGRKFRRQCANVIDTTWGHIYFLTCKNVGLCVQFTFYRGVRNMTVWNHGIIKKEGYTDFYNKSKMVTSSLITAHSPINPSLNLYSSLTWIRTLLLSSTAARPPRHFIYIFSKVSSCPHVWHTFL